MDELIRKEDALNALDDEITITGRQNAIIFTDYVRRVARKINDLPSAQLVVVPHKNYRYLSDYWCECGCHLGKQHDVKYCPDCGKKVKWDE